MGLALDHLSSPATNGAGGIVAPIAPPRRALLRVLGNAFGLALVVGATIGGGILGTPGSVAAALPSTALFLGAWIFGGVSALLGATIYSELGAMVPRSGGVYVFARRAFGDGVGFVVGYGDWINWSIGISLLIMLVGEYLGGLFPIFSGHAQIAGCLVFAVLAIFQWLGVLSGGRVQQVTSVLKAVALLALVVAAFAMPHASLPPAASPPVLPHGWGLVMAFGVAMQGVMFSYDSYYAVVYCGDEIRDPGRAIPRTIFSGLAVVIVVYLLINVAYLAVVPVQQVAGDPFIGGTVSRLIFGARGDTIIRVIAIGTILSTANGLIIAAPRILHAMARDRLFLSAAAYVNPGGTPTVALALTMILVGALLFTGSFSVVLGIDGFFITLAYLTTFAALFRLRHTEPDTPRPYRAWGYPWVQLLAVASMAGLVVAMAAGDRKGALITAVVLLASWPAWEVVKRLRARAL